MNAVVATAVPGAVATALARTGLEADVLAVTPTFGGVHELWRVETTGGAWAIHLIDHRDGRGADFWQRVHDLEVAAIGAGVPAPQPVVDASTGHPLIPLDDGNGVIVHAWIDAEPVAPDRAHPSFHAALGAALGATHSCGFDPGVERDELLALVPAEEWLDLGHRAVAAGWPWGRALVDGADRFAAATRLLDEWAATAAEPPVFSHRDLTTANVLDDGGRPVLIDWESCGPIGRGDEIGRTVLDQFLGAGADDGRLDAFLAGYRSRADLPIVGAHWCGLWIRGLIVFAAYCARSCLAAAEPTAQTAFQSRVVESTPAELERRLAAVDDHVAAFGAAVARTVRR